MSHNVSETGLKVSRYSRWKQLPDRLAALIMLIPALPVILLLCVAIRLTSRGAAIYKQSRLGLDAREFTLFKLRSMTVDAESKSGAVWTTDRRDNRITWLGRILRATHLDELPQLFNVLRGEMSLVGPRPERPEFVLILDEEIEHYRDRLKVMPGITGLAQVNLPPDTDVASVKRKQQLDIDYVQTASCWLDCRILLATGLRLMGLRGERVQRLLGLYRKLDEPVEEAEETPVPTASPAPIAASSLGMAHGRIATSNTRLR